MCMRPTWVEISRHRLLANYACLRSLAGTADLLAVVKADAYGHGLDPCAPLLAAAGAEWLGITSVGEGIRTRSLCPGPSRILVLSGLWRGEAEAAIEHHLTPVVWEDFHLDEIEAAALNQGLPAQSVAVHLEIDTGMARQGVPAPSAGASDAPQLTQILARFNPSSPLRLEGIMTHFVAAESLASDESKHQLSRLGAALELVAAAGLRFRWLHAGASATLLAGHDVVPLFKLAQKAGARLMLRPGLALYGYAPRFDPLGSPADRFGAALKPILTWKTRVVSTRVVPAGETVSYNGTFLASRPTRLALLAVGYADGLNRLLSNRGSLLLRGERAPIAGRICMDQCMLDITDIPGVEIGDEVVILGDKTGGDKSSSAMDAHEYAHLVGSIPWEVLCDIGPRVPRMVLE